jgi:hypothetical protein
MLEQSDPNLSIIRPPDQELDKPGENPPLPDNYVEPEWVIRYKARRKRKGWWLRWVALVIQWIIAAFVAWIFYIIPVDPTVGPFHNWKNPVIIFILVCFIGKTLIDTLFYDHYQP